MSPQRPWGLGGSTGQGEREMGDLGRHWEINGETTMWTRRVAGRMRETVALNVTSDMQDAGHDVG